MKKVSVAFLVLTISLTLSGCDGNGLLDDVIGALIGDNNETGLCDKGVWEGRFLVETSEDLLLLKGYTSIDGSLVITSTNLQNLNGLECLETVSSMSILHNGLLEDITGINGITTVTGDIYIHDNEHLTNLDGLDHLTSVGGDFEIAMNPMLSDLNGLNSLSNVSGYFGIGANDVLTNFDGLESLTSVGALGFGELPALENIDGLSNLATIDGEDPEIAIAECEYLSNLDALSNMVAANAKIEIENNPNLVQIDGLHNITTAKYIKIENNDILQHLNGLLSLTSVTGSLMIYNNALLPTLDGLSNLLTVNECIYIFGNSLLPECEINALLEHISSYCSAECHPPISRYSLPNACSLNTCICVQDNGEICE